MMKTESVLLAIVLCCYASAVGQAQQPQVKTDTKSAIEAARLFRAEAGLQALPPLGVRQIVFTTRLAYDDSHWYANIGYYCDDENHKAYAGNGGPDESNLYVLDTETGQVGVVFDAKGGSIRDPHVHYDGRTLLFSYRPPTSDYYNLYEIQIDGAGLRQVTHGPFDDYEAVYLPDDDIVFVSTRSKRWVGCWMTQVGTLFRCDRRGGNMRPLSFNCEHDNTPAVLPDGRILYTRWEYVDRSQVGYHQLWTMNPDGTAATTYFGNEEHYPLFIGAKPIPGRNEVLLIDSPGHGRTDHRGHVSTISPDHGPDSRRGYRRLTPQAAFNDPSPVGDGAFLVAQNKRMLLGTYDGSLTPVLTYTGAAAIHEPAPVLPRPREQVLADRTDPRQATGRMLLMEVHTGRNMEGVLPGQIRSLLVLETLPKPVNFSGGMDLTSWMGTFMLERVLGTVPVEEDGSAYFEVPAGRPVLFVALDENDLSVKRMQSFTNVMSGETLGCIGCHEPRTQIPPSSTGVPLAMRRPPSRIKPFRDFPDVIDFRRDVQPILDRHCASCHNDEDPQGHVVLTEDLGTTWSISYFTLFAAGQVADGRNGFGNQPARTIGSSASRLMSKIDGSHHDVKVSPEEWRMLWLWLEIGAPYAGTYAALRNAEDQARVGPAHAVFRAPALVEGCNQCHAEDKDAPPLPVRLTEQQRRQIVRERGLATYERIVQKDDLRFSSHVLLNMSRPERSALLLGPLPKEAGGWGTCAHRFLGTQDANYQALLSEIRRGKEHLDGGATFGRPAFRPNRQYIREMKRFGVLPAEFDATRDPIDVFDVDQRYWRLFWYEPESRNPWPFMESTKLEIRNPKPPARETRISNIEIRNRHE